MSGNKKDLTTNMVSIYYVLHAVKINTLPFSVHHNYPEICAEKVFPSNYHQRIRKLFYEVTVWHNHNVKRLLVKAYVVVPIFPLI